MMPTNTDDLVPGLKRNENKPMVTLVHPQMVIGLARVFEFGLKKYARNSWMSFTPEQAASCLPDAGMRHMYRWLEGERIDPETGCHHLLQAAWNFLVMWWIETFRGGEDA